MRRLGRFVLYSLLGLAIVAAAAIYWRRELLDRGIRFGLARAGIPEARFVVERVDLDAVHLIEVDAGPFFRARRIEIALDLGRLPELPVERVRLVAASIDLSQPAKEKVEGETGSERPRQAGDLPFGLLPVLEIENSRVLMPSTVGPIVLSLDSRVAPAEDGVSMTLAGRIDGEAARATLRGEARLATGGAVSLSMDVGEIAVRDPRLVVGSGSLAVRLNGTADGLDLEKAEGSIDLSLGALAAGERKLGDVVASLPLALERKDQVWGATLAEASVRLLSEGLAAERISGEISAVAADLTIERLTDLQSPRRFEPLSVRVRAPRFQPDAAFTLDLAAASGRVSLHVIGSYDPADGTIRAELDWPGFELDRAGLKPTDLSPLLAFDGSIAARVEGRASVRRTKAGKIDGKATIAVENVDLEMPALRVEGLGGKIQLRALAPLETDGVQEIVAREIHPGIALRDVTLRFALEPGAPGKSRLRIERLECAFAGGRILVDAALLDPQAATNSMAFRFDAIDVASLFEIAGVEGVTGTGKLSGSIPIAVGEGKFAVPGGKLEGSAGVLQVRSGSADQLLAGGGESTGLLLDALRDFHYESITMAIDKSADGEASARLSLAGHNPAVLDGHPFRINLNLTGNLDRLLGALVEVARLSDRAVRAAVTAVE